VTRPSGFRVKRLRLGQPGRIAPSRLGNSNKYKGNVSCSPSFYFISHLRRTKSSYINSIIISILQTIYIALSRLVYIAV
jgi:hypothetical protein